MKTLGVETQRGFLAQNKKKRNKMCPPQMIPRHSVTKQASLVCRKGMER